jgi:hypothetical protein
VELSFAAGVEAVRDGGFCFHIGDVTAGKTGC